MGSLPVLLKQFNNRLLDSKIKNLQSKVNESSTSAYYKHYKSIAQVEQYPSIDVPGMYNIPLSNFICSGHYLMIEKGTHLHLENDYRYCPVCLHNWIRTVEDEMLFLLTTTSERNYSQLSGKQTLCVNGHFIILWQTKKTQHCPIVKIPV